MGSSTSYFTYEQAQQRIAEILAAPPLNASTRLIARAQAVHDSTDLWSTIDPSVQLLRMVGFDAADLTTECTAAPCNARQVVGSPAGSVVSINVAAPLFPLLCPSLCLGSGDGTVPLYSANVFNPAKDFDYRGGAHNLYWCGMSHTDLAHSTAVWSVANQILTGAVTYDADAMGPGGVCPDGSAGTVAGLLAASTTR